MKYSQEEAYNIDKNPMVKGQNSSSIKISGLTDFFRDPEIFQLIRTQVLPYLDTFPLYKVWHIGCSTGEEVYSMSILLDQASMLKNATLFATDIYKPRLQKARAGKYEVQRFERYEQNFLQSGLSGSFSDYFSDSTVALHLLPRLLASAHFFQHDILQGGSPNTFSCIYCRNVLFYYTSQEQEIILKKLLDSLEPMGFLILGRVEDLRFSHIRHYVKPIRKGYPIYQKITS